MASSSIFNTMPARIDIDPGLKGAVASMARLPEHTPTDIKRVTVIPGRNRRTPVDQRDGLPAIPVTPFSINDRGVQFASNHVRSRSGAVEAVPQSPFLKDAGRQTPVEVGHFAETEDTTPKGLKKARLKPVGDFSATDRGSTSLSVAELHPQEPVIHNSLPHEPHGHLLTPAAPPDFELDEKADIFVPRQPEKEESPKPRLPQKIDDIISAAARFMQDRNEHASTSLKVSKREALRHVLDTHESSEPLNEITENQLRVARLPISIDPEILYKRVIAQSTLHPIYSSETGRVYPSPGAIEGLQTWLTIHLKGEADPQSKFVDASRASLHYEAAMRGLQQRWDAMETKQNDSGDPIDPETHLPASGIKELPTNAKEALAGLNVNAAKAAEQTALREGKEENPTHEQLIVAGQQLIKHYTDTGNLEPTSFIEDGRVVAVDHAVKQLVRAQNDPNFVLSPSVPKTIIAVLDDLGIHHTQLVSATSK